MMLILYSPHCLTLTVLLLHPFTHDSLGKPVPERQNHQQQQQPPFNGRLTGTTRVCWYQKKHSPAHTHPGQHTSSITFLHLQWSTASSLFSLRAWQSSRTTSLVIPLVLNPQLHTPCISSLNHHHLFTAHAHTNATCSVAISMLSSTHSLSLISLLGSLSGFKRGKR